MTVPLLSTRTTNVELTPKRRDLLKDKLFPLTRYINDTSIAYFDVVIRQERSKVSGDQFYVSVKLATTTNRYVGVSVGSTLNAALLEVRDTLRRQLCESKDRSRYSKPEWVFDPVQLA